VFSLFRAYLRSPFSFAFVSESNARDGPFIFLNFPPVIQTLPPLAIPRIVPDYTAIRPRLKSKIIQSLCRLSRMDGKGARSFTPNVYPRIDDNVLKVMEKARSAHHNLPKLDVKKAVIYGTKSVPECVEGCWTSRDWIQEAGGKGQEFIIQDVNHFVQFHEPKKLLKAIMEV
jgi:pimeloyl-ACP methyl ester carboxylesterase